MADVSGLLVRDVVSEMRAVPHDHVSAIDRFTGQPRIEAGFVRRPRGDYTIVDLRAAIAQEPNVTARERPVERGGRNTVARARDDVVRFPGRFVFYLPPPLARRVAGAANFIVFVVPV